MTPYEMAYEIQEARGWISENNLLKGGLTKLIARLPEKIARDILENCYFVCLETMAPDPRGSEPDKGLYLPSELGRHVIVFGKNALKGNTVYVEVALHELGHFVHRHEWPDKLSKEEQDRQQDEAVVWVRERMAEWGLRKDDVVDFLM